MRVCVLVVLDQLVVVGLAAQDVGVDCLDVILLDLVEARQIDDSFPLILIEPMQVFVNCVLLGLFDCRRVDILLILVELLLIAEFLLMLLHVLQKAHLDLALKFCTVEDL